MVEYQYWAAGAHGNCSEAAPELQQGNEEDAPELQRENEVAVCEPLLESVGGDVRGEGEG